MIDTHFLTTIALIVALAMLWYATQGHPWHGRIMLATGVIAALTVVGAYKQQGPTDAAARMHNDQRYRIETGAAQPLPERRTKQDTAFEDFMRESEARRNKENP